MTVRPHPLPDGRRRASSASGVVTVLARRNAVGDPDRHRADPQRREREPRRVRPLRARRRCAGQVFALFVLAIAAAEAAVALAIILNVFDSRDRIDVDEITA